MPQAHAIIQDSDGSRTLTAYLDGEVIAVNDDHPNFDALVEAVTDGDESASEVRELADLSAAVGAAFADLSDRIKVAGGSLYVDGNVQDSSITRYILRCLDDPTVGDYRPLVRFQEKVADNPNPHSREQLYDWLASKAFTITVDGDVVAYKGVTRRGDGVLVSQHAGGGIVNGERVEGQVPQAVGDTVELPRDYVTFDPAVSCARGLHVGTYDYAQSWAQGAMLRVVVDPRDFVSVPNGEGEKARVCRYTVDAEVAAPVAVPVLYESGFAGGEPLDDDEYDEWDDAEADGAVDRW